MPTINYASKEIQFKIVYYGPALSGKTTNLVYIHSRIAPAHRGDLISLATAADRTLFFDFLPLSALTLARIQNKIPALHGTRAGDLQLNPAAGLTQR